MTHNLTKHGRLLLLTLLLSTLLLACNLERFIGTPTPDVAPPALVVTAPPPTFTPLPTSNP